MNPMTKFPCARPGCGKHGRYSCGNCRLISYCHKHCQVADWPEHKKLCKSSLMKQDWKPSWETENRLPAFPSPQLEENIHYRFGKETHLWGNVPAVDVLNLPHNEGSDFPHDLAILFAASGDLRNVVKTVSELPWSFTQRIDMVLNDKEFHVVARNAILLLFCLKALEVSSTSLGRSTDAEILTHIWYSASLRKDIADELVLRVKPLFTEVCENVSELAAGEVSTWSWDFAHNKSLYLTLTKEQWYQIEALCEAPSSLTLQNASDIRTATTLAPERQDIRDRWFLKHRTPSMRLSKQKFREHGILLPFGHDRTAFGYPNPTFYLPSSDVWPMDDRSDPLNGWPIQEVVRVQTIATEDIYGKLYVYLRDLFERFLSRLAQMEVNFELRSAHPTELLRIFQVNKFARIDVSNITDVSYLGTHQTLNHLTPLLQPPDQNPHGTIISAYLDATLEMIHQEDDLRKVAFADFLMKYLPTSDFLALAEKNFSACVKLWDAQHLVFDRNKLFLRYINLHGFDQISAHLQVVMKDLHTVVEAWLTSLKLRPGQPGAQEEFNNLLGSNFNCTERFVEWKRAK